MSSDLSHNHFFPSFTRILMTYIELINRFWQLDEKDPFTSQETRLYFYLLRTSNLLDWPRSWSRKNITLAAEVGISVTTLYRVRDRLQQTGLIRYVAGERGAGNKTRYFLADAPCPGTVTGKTLPDTPLVADYTYPGTTTGPQKEASGAGNDPLSPLLPFVEDTDGETPTENNSPTASANEDEPSDYQSTATEATSPSDVSAFGQDLDFYRRQALEDMRWKKHVAQKSRIGIRKMMEIFPRQMEVFLSYAIASCKEQRIRDKEGLQRLFYYWWCDQGEEEYLRSSYWEETPSASEGVGDWEQKLIRVKEWIRAHAPNLVPIRQQLTASNLRAMYHICRDDTARLAEVLSAVNNDRFLLNRSASVYDAWKEKYRKLYGE
ncbi:MAG: hypothetical protein LUF04_07845 [Bacteroides sp.]|nr:hypothetical protein [Bacteroides sp.]